MNQMKKLLFFLSCLYSFSFAFAQKLSISFSHLEEKTGTLCVAVYCSEEQFKSQTMEAKKRIELNAKTPSITFNDLPLGKLAVAVFVDENKNTKLDSKKNGIPIEPFGFSNNPNLGIPTFQKIAFDFQKDTSIQIDVKHLK